ncbi:hypothetical protein GS597_05350 [Synechococcales cyanobacterium C]|uniref:Uncharacterized protein n=1 Tax=Petrachloros mirabilis ULC683 TaxID=2781853 RepID=A0A8K1ZYG0_9CYAN|nr:hypothetical protein [Petrachloros mirabilis]NCJ05947.1 hypothetical protein [Petrachloros mirabilis ULC683]
MGHNRHVYRTSPLIRLALWGLYLTLLVPLPFLAQVNGMASGWLWVALVAGGVVLQAALSEQIWVDEDGIEVCYPLWVPTWFRPGWRLRWSEIQSLKPRSTGQGGRVFYFTTTAETAYLLPMRVAGFAAMTRQIEDHTGLDLRAVKPLAQIWMYSILLGFVLMLAGVDGWVLWTVSVG